MELLYDLVYVFILARIADTLFENLNWLGAYQSLLLLLAAWWVWSYTALATDTLNSERPPAQLLVIAIMFGTLVLGVSLPEAFEERGLYFASAYVGIHLFRSGFLAVVLRNNRLRHRPFRGIFWFGISGVLWLAGAVRDGHWRVLLWTIALAIDYLTPLLRWPTPFLGRSPRWEWKHAGEHLVERYRQFINIALGETILVMARTFRGSDHGLHRGASLVVSFMTTVLQWWIYFYRTREKLGPAIGATAESQSDSRMAGHAHLIMVAGIVATTVGDQIIIEHPSGGSHPGWVAIIVGGPALFLAGRTLLGHESTVHVIGPWLVGCAVLLLMSPAMLLLPPLGVAITTTTVLLGVAVADTISTGFDVSHRLTRRFRRS